jgi:hypothetical protein
MVRPILRQRLRRAGGRLLLRALRSFMQSRELAEGSPRTGLAHHEWD